jgi:glutathione S-transferase
MKYFSVAEARQMDGIKLVLTANIPGPWSESAKYIFRIKNIPFIPVAQLLAQPNEELQAWTGTRNAPIVMVDGMPPKSNWADILMLAERLQPDPPLMPAASAARAEVFGICAELCGEGGLLWTSRVLSLAATNEGPAFSEIMHKAYGGTPAEVEAAPARIADILGTLDDRLRTQVRRGSPYLIGNKLHACDIYWACISQAVSVLPQELCPLKPELRAIYERVPSPTREACTPLLLKHRDYIYKKYIGLPLDL